MGPVSSSSSSSTIYRDASLETKLQGRVCGTAVSELWIRQPISRKDVRIKKLQAPWHRALDHAPTTMVPRWRRYSQLLALHDQPTKPSFRRLSSWFHRPRRLARRVNPKSPKLAVLMAFAIILSASCTLLTQTRFADPVHSKTDSAAVLQTSVNQLSC